MAMKILCEITSDNLKEYVKCLKISKQHQTELFFEFELGIEYLGVEKQ